MADELFGDALPPVLGGEYDVNDPTMSSTIASTTDIDFSAPVNTNDAEQNASERAEEDKNDEDEDELKDLFGASDEESDADADYSKPTANEEEEELEEKPRKQKLSRLKKKKRKRSSESDSAVEDEETPKRKKRKRKQAKAAAEGGEVVTGKRKRKTKDATLSLQQEQKIMEQVVSFIERMNEACDKDIQANKNGQPAVNKLNMLDEVSAMLNKIHLHEKLMESQILSAIRKWLEPLPDRTLPNVKIREELLRGLLKLHPPRNDSQYWQYRLRESGIGRIVMFLYKNEEETVTNRRMARELIERWSRPVFDLSERWTDAQREEERARHRPLPRLSDSSLTPTVPPGTPGYKAKNEKFPPKADMNYVRRPRDLVDFDAKKDRTPGRVALFEKKLKGITDQK